MSISLSRVVDHFWGLLDIFRSASLRSKLRRRKLWVCYQLRVESSPGADVHVSGLVPAVVLSHRGQLPASAPLPKPLLLRDTPGRNHKLWGPHSSQGEAPPASEGYRTGMGPDLRGLEAVYILMFPSFSATYSKIKENHPTELNGFIESSTGGWCCGTAG